MIIVWIERFVLFAYVIVLFLIDLWNTDLAWHWHVDIENNLKILTVFTNVSDRPFLKALTSVGVGVWHTFSQRCWCWWCLPDLFFWGVGATDKLFVLLQLWTYTHIWMITMLVEFRKNKIVKILLTPFSFSTTYAYWIDVVERRYSEVALNKSLLLAKLS